MSNIEDHAEGKIRHYGMQIGLVTDNVDPGIANGKGNHRVRAMIPGLVEPQTDWLLPLTAGGGGPQRGGHIVPSIGSKIAIWFHQGDLEGHGAYLCLNWAEPPGGSELPGDLLDEDNAHQIQTMQIDGLRITIDERPTKRSFKVVDVDPTTGEAVAAIVIDRESRGILLSANTAVMIKTLGIFSVEATEVVIKGRRMNASDKGW